MVALSNSDYLNLLNGSPPTGWTLKAETENPSTGLSARAYENANGQVIFVFLGLITPKGGNGADITRMPKSWQGNSPKIC